MRKYIDAPLLIALAMAVLLLPLRWLAAWLIAVFVHEMCHYAAVRLFRGEVIFAGASIGGARMEAAGLSRAGQLLSCAAGPIGSLMLILFVRIWPALALCGAAQGLFNLLPLFPLDGGQILRLALQSHPSGEAAEKAIRVCLLGIIWGGCIYVSIALHMGILPLMAGLYLQLRTNLRKRP